jgi:hypothetical protein
MAIRTEGACPISTNIYIRKQAKKEKISLREMMRRYSKESETPYATLDNWVHPRKKNDAKNGVISEPDQKRTEQEIKEYVSQIIERIEKGEISEDDVKDILDTAAAGIGKKVYPIGVGAEVQPAIKAVRQKNKSKGPKPKQIDKFDRLHKLGLKFLDGLKAWADGKMKPENSDEDVCAQAILKGADSCIVQYGRLGIDVVGVYETFLEGNEDDKDEIRNTESTDAG